MMRGPDHWANMRREIERILSYPPGTTDPVTPSLDKLGTRADRAVNLALTEDIHRLNQSFAIMAVKDWDRTGEEGCFAVFVHAYVAECWRWIARNN